MRIERWAVLWLFVWTGAAAAFAQDEQAESIEYRDALVVRETLEAIMARPEFRRLTETPEPEPSSETASWLERLFEWLEEVLASEPEAGRGEPEKKHREPPVGSHQGASDGDCLAEDVIARSGHDGGAQKRGHEEKEQPRQKPTVAIGRAEHSEGDGNRTEDEREREHFADVAPVKQNGDVDASADRSRLECEGRLLELHRGSSPRGKPGTLPRPAKLR